MPGGRPRCMYSEYMVVGATVVVDPVREHGRVRRAGRGRARVELVEDLVPDEHERQAHWRRPRPGSGRRRARRWPSRRSASAAGARTSAGSRSRRGRRCARGPSGVADGRDPVVLLQRRVAVAGRERVGARGDRRRSGWRRRSRTATTTSPTPRARSGASRTAAPGSRGRGRCIRVARVAVPVEPAEDVEHRLPVRCSSPSARSPAAGVGGLERGRGRRHRARRQAERLR